MNVILRRIRVTIVAVENQSRLLHTLSMSIALAIQHAKRMRPFILSAVVFLDVPCFPPSPL
jgi:hypothetical protein